MKYLTFSFFDNAATQEFFKFLNASLEYPKRSSMRQDVLKHFNVMKAAVFTNQRGSFKNFTDNRWVNIDIKSIVLRYYNAVH